MNTIWKYDLEIIDRQIVEVPLGAMLLSVKTQGENKVCVWYQVDSRLPLRSRTVAIIGTGHTLPADCHSNNFVDTVLTFGGKNVWHVFDINKPY